MKKSYPSFFAFLVTVILLGSAACGLAPTATAVVPTPVPSQTSVPPTLQPVDSERSLRINGLERAYLLHIPAGLVTGAPVPLVFVFHCLGEAANLIQQASGMNPLNNAIFYVRINPACESAFTNRCIQASLF